MGRDGIAVWPEILAIESAEKQEPVASNKAAARGSVGRDFRMNTQLPIKAPALFCGLNLSGDTDSSSFRMYEKLQEGDPFFFCALRSLSLHPLVAADFLDKEDFQGRHDVFIVVEGLTRALPIWQCSQRPEELEVLAPCLTQYVVVRDPIQ